MPGVTPPSAMVGIISTARYKQRQLVSTIDSLRQPGQLSQPGCPSNARVRFLSTDEVRGERSAEGSRVLTGRLDGPRCAERRDLRNSARGRA